MNKQIVVLTFTLSTLSGCQPLSHYLPSAFRPSEQLPAVTERGFQVEIDGDGYFQFIREDGSRAFTRDGSFRFNVAGRVTTPEGYPLEPPITIPVAPPPSTIDPIRADGTVFTTAGAQSAIIGNLLLHRFKDSSGLRSIGKDRWEPTPWAGPVMSGQPTLDGFGRIVWKGFVGEER